MYAGRSPYEYALSNPVRFIDPTGMGPEDPPLKVVQNFFNSIKKRIQNFGVDKGKSINSKPVLSNKPAVINDKKALSPKSDAKYQGSIRKETSKLVLRGSVKTSLGAQIGGKVGVVSGSVGAMTQEIRSANVDVFKGTGDTKWGNGRVHNYIEANAGLGNKTSLPLSIEAKADYSYEYNRALDNGFSGVKGTDSFDWSAKLGLDLGTVIGPENLNAQPAATGGYDSSSDCHCIDFGVGVKVLFGVEVNVQIGVLKND